jgi:hypothetical protein
MVQDLIKYDGSKERISTLNSSLSLKDSYIAKQDSMMSIYQRKVQTYQSSIQEYQLIDESNQRIIESTKLRDAKHKRQRNAFIYFSGALIIGIIAK